ncbi:hypothetical protein [Bordetella bronchiseptica]|uniref:hypothetical protein n=1 Tax=Bordetella bronchiseptica TaxID=518 RepID=UPI0037D28225
MTLPNLTPQSADMALDPMAGTLARTAMQCAARGCDGYLVCRPAAAAQVVQERPKTGAAPDNFARAQSLQMFEPARRVYQGRAPTVNVNILALDLGTKLGWAVRGRDGRTSHGTEVFTPRASWSPGQRWLRARSFLVEVITQRQVHAIAYEDVKRHTGTDAAHAYGAFLCIVEMLADSHRLRLLPVGVGTIKKHWTGKGNADKADMIAEAKARGFRPETDNDADALAILSWAVAQERAA